MANVVNEKLEDFIVPLPLDSTNARNVLSYRKIIADVIHIDAGHDYDAVRSDMEQWWQVLRPGGVFIGDDYRDDGEWGDVKAAIDSFLSEQPHKDFRHWSGKCWAVKL